MVSGGANFAALQTQLNQVESQMGDLNTQSSDKKANIANQQRLGILKKKAGSIRNQMKALESQKNTAADNKAKKKEDKKKGFDENGGKSITQTQYKSGTEAAKEVKSNVSKRLNYLNQVGDAKVGGAKVSGQGEQPGSQNNNASVDSKDSSDQAAGGVKKDKGDTKEE